ncbi:hypothetical protein C8Q76DRAFT_694454 [Earliella scabrosa]|nr:hypothetical protein C8Q76DRAFT_694454 [Earliella scabrosa]
MTALNSTEPRTGFDMSEPPSRRVFAIETTLFYTVPLPSSNHPGETSSDTTSVAGQGDSTRLPASPGKFTRTPLASSTLFAVGFLETQISLWVVEGYLRDSSRLGGDIGRRTTFRLNGAPGAKHQQPSATTFCTISGPSPVSLGLLRGAVFHVYRQHVEDFERGGPK